ncbi:MAG: PUR family DNA/RNA-binding protein [Bacteroidota bacterium]|nr:PUR family DNA/RNA-binding protein [Bacteroidota bacterium]
MEDYNKERRDEVFSRRIKAGKRTYFMDVKATRGNDFFITITESKRRLNGDGYDKHKVYLYKEDFNKFLEGLAEAIAYVKTELMPDYDFEQFNHALAGEDWPAISEYEEPAAEDHQHPNS